MSNHVEWGVKYTGFLVSPDDDPVYPYESEAEARRQLNLAQMDVPAILVTRVGDGPWMDAQNS